MAWVIPLTFVAAVVCGFLARRLMKRSNEEAGDSSLLMSLTHFPVGRMRPTERKPPDS